MESPFWSTSEESRTCRSWLRLLLMLKVQIRDTLFGDMCFFSDSMFRGIFFGILGERYGVFELRCVLWCFRVTTYFGVFRLLRSMRCFRVAADFELFVESWLFRLPESWRCFRVPADLAVVYSPCRLGGFRIRWRRDHWNSVAGSKLCLL